MMLPSLPVRRELAVSRPLLHLLVSCEIYLGFGLNFSQYNFIPFSNPASLGKP